MTIGQRIAQKRKELPLSQEALGEQLGVSRQSIYKWESDAALPEIDKLIALSKLFGVSVGWLLGVEDETPDDAPPSDTGELTDAQLRMVEELAERYIAAQPKKSAWDKWSVRFLFVMCGAMLGILVGVSGNVKQLDGRYNELQSSISYVTVSVDSQISSISNRMEELLKSQNTLAADYSTQVASMDYAGNTVTFSFRAIPKTFSPGMTAWLEVQNDTGSFTCGPYEPQGQTFAGEAAVALTDNISLCIVFEADGRREAQMLAQYDRLYTDSLPAASVSDYSSWGHASGGDGSPQLSLYGGTLVAQDQSPASSPGIASIRVGAFLNQQLLAWAEALPECPRAFHYPDVGALFFSSPKLSHPIQPGDCFCFAAVVTDAYGRVNVCPGSILQLSGDGTQMLPAAPYALPNEWQFE